MPSVPRQIPLMVELSAYVPLVPDKQPIVNHIYEGDCRDVLTTFESGRTAGQ